MLVSLGNKRVKEGERNTGRIMSLKLRIMSLKLRNMLKSVVHNAS